MRPIKFRGKSLNNGEWVYGSLITCERYTDIRTVAEDGVVTRAEANPDTVGQFTGLYDKNGTEIYEGDLVSTSNHKGQVKWMSGKCCFQISPGGVFLTPKCQVLGNIHDNPELLKTE